MGGKQKGNQWERVAAGDLSVWFGKDFKRLPASGALRWGGVTWTYGDLLPPEGAYMVVECKHHHQISLDDCLGTQRSVPGTGQVVEWWEDQCLRDAARAAEELGRSIEPFLLWKQDRIPPRICMTWKFFQMAELSSSMPFFTVCFDPKKPGFVCVNFKQFLEKMSAEKFAELVS